jgi:hypothetical protein
MKALGLSAVVGASLTLGLFGEPLGLVFADQTARVAQPPIITIEIDRTHKGDRRAPRDTPATTPTGAKPAMNDPRLVPTGLGGCEPLASPVAEPALSRWAGRCFV